MTFSYVAFDRAGKEVHGSIDAANVDQAQEQLRGKGLYVSKISAGNSAAKAADSRSRDPMPPSTSRYTKELSGFARQLSVLVGSGTPLVEGLQAVEKQTRNPHMREVLAGVRKRVEEGASMADAMAAYPEVFDAVTRSLIVAGESGGRLDEMLTHLAELLRQQVRARAQIVGAMVYPVLLIGVAITVLTVMVAFVLPRFESLFKNLGSALPPTTQILMDVSNLLRSQWYFVIPSIVGASFALRHWAMSSAGRRAIAGVMIDLPKIGGVTRSFICARMVRLLGVLLHARVPMLEALQLVRESTTNWRYAELVAKAEDSVTRGESLAAVLEESPLITPAVAEAFRSGERSGRIGPVLVQVADYLDEDNEVVLKSLSSIIEPLILLMLGVVVGGVAMSMFLPLFDLASGGANGPGGGG